MIRHIVPIFCLLALVPLSGCSTGKTFSNASPQLVAAPDAVSARLAEAADRASNALENLAAVESAKKARPALTPISNAPRELQRAVTISWTGPAEPITKILAERASYNFMIKGSPPPLAQVVSIDVENQPVIEVLRNIGLQLGNRADLKVDGNRKVVEIHYAPVTGFGG